MTHDWPVLESTVEYETDWYTGGYDLVEQPDGSTKRYYWAELPPAVVVLAVTDDQVVFVEQYRPVVGETCLECPAGIVEREAQRASNGASGPRGGEITSEETASPSPGPRAERESYTAAAARELREETGFDADGLTLLESFDVATGVLRHERGIVFAEGLTPAEQNLDENEFLTVRAVPIEDALDAAREPPVNDATLEALLLGREEGLL